MEGDIGEKQLFGFVRLLEERLAASTADTKIVFAHHPLFTKGKRHSSIGKCLRSPTYIYRGRETLGYDLLRILHANRVSMYLSGHEHVSQYHLSKGECENGNSDHDEETADNIVQKEIDSSKEQNVNQMHCFVAGATTKWGFYGGMSEEIEIDW